MVGNGLSRYSRRWLCLMALIIASAGFPVAANELQEIEVGVTTHLGDQQKFIAGDVVSFLLSLDNDAYVYLFYEDAEANIFLIYPNQKSRNHHYGKGFFMPLPPSNEKFRFRIQAPFGEETLFVFASDNAEVNLPGHRLPNGFDLVEASLKAIEASIRHQSESLFGAAKLVLLSRPN